MVPFTFDTFPRGIVYLRSVTEKNSVYEFLVTAISPTSITIKNLEVGFDPAMNHWEISTDNCETWCPAGLEVTE